MNQKLSIDESFINKLTSILKVNFENENFGVSELAAEIGYSRSQLHRKLKSTNGKSTSQFIREYRLKKSMEMLKQNQATASEIAFRAGFSSPTYFNTCFHNFYGYPPGEVKNQRVTLKQKSGFSKKMLSIIPIIIIIGLIIYNKAFKKTTNKSANIEKSIAVLPFINNSNNEENMYFCNGIMAGIRDQLSKIPEFTIVSRRSVERYRNSSIPLKTIAKELNVNYVIEGQVQRVEDRAIVSAELIRIEDNKVLWSDRYDENVSEIFTVQKNVIQSITNNLEILISPNLKNELKSIPTQNKTAYEYYLKGEEYRFKANRAFQKHEVWLDLITKAKSSYEQAIKTDSLFSSAYLGLAFTTFEQYGNYVGDKNNINEVLNLTNQAIELNPNNAMAYNVRGDYFMLYNNVDKAILDYEKSLSIYPNNMMALINSIDIYERRNKHKEAILTLKKAEAFAHSRWQLMRLYTEYLEFYRRLDNPLMVDYYFDKIFNLQTTKRFRRDRVYSFIQFRRFDDALNYVNKNLLKDNQQRNALLGMLNMYKGDFIKGESYWKKCYAQVEKEGINSLASRVVYWGYGMCLIRNGQIEEGKDMLRKQVTLYNTLISSKESLDTPVSYYQLFFLHAALGDLKTSNEYIDKFEAANGWLFWNFVLYIRADLETGLFDGDLDYLQASIKKGEKQLKEAQNQIRPYLPSAPPNGLD
ncbi:helix-turn-helix domain-containing protein [Algibacter mikhailovii]|uniref:helix-turn-helix domain-containing protein n=1 Tax=Algibacter mikhailovii TaxID=425498 RepID=UPI0024941658|nr:helix-turn-helix domain-containing protein [Algibacter mikhailovii]